MPWTRVTQFGPGALEAVRLHLWAAGRTDGQRLLAEARGTFTVYCGAGNQHTVAISSRADIWRSWSDETAVRVAAAYDRDKTAAEALARELIEDQLEESAWTCECPTPCPTTG